MEHYGGGRPSQDNRPLADTYTLASHNAGMRGDLALMAFSITVTALRKEIRSRAGTQM